MNVRKNNYFSESESNIITLQMATQPVNLKGKLNVYNDLNVTGTATIGTLDVGSLDLGSSGFSTTGSISVENLFLGNGTIPQPFISFVDDTNTGITNSASDELSMYTNGFNRLTVNNSGVTVGTATNNLNLIVNGISSATTFRAGDGVQGTPSYSFTNGQGTDTGMYYVYDAVNNADRIRFSVNNTFIQELNTTQSYFNNRLLANNSAGNNTTPAVIFSTDSSTTGYSGQRTNASTDPRLWAIVNGVQATELTTTQFNVGLTNSNNTNMKTLNQNGASNFNSFTPTYTSIINTQVTAGRTDANWFGIDYNPTTGVYIIGSNNSGTGIVRVAVSGSNNLTTWTTYNDTTFAFGNMRHIVYGNTPNIWVAGTSSSVQRNFYYSTNTINWTLVSDTGSNSHFATPRAYTRLKWINGQFVGLSSGSNVAFSTDGINWTLRQINATSYTLNDIVYSSELRMYVITTTSATVLYFNDTTGTGITASTTFTAQTTNVYASNAVAWSPKLSTFIIQSVGSATQWASSSDGINWRTFTTTALNANNGRIEWVPDFGGFFVACQQATTNNSIVSRDGITWTQIALSISGNSRGFYYNSSQKVFVFGLDANLTFKNALTDFNNYVDSDNIYNTFNSNIRFADVIEYQNQVITPVSGNSHFSLSQFTRPEVVFNTTSANANIYLQGTSFNGRVGCKFKFIKNTVSSNDLRIHGFETCTLISPTGNVIGFNAQSNPQTYTIVPAGYFGSFVLTRISDTGTGVWMIDSVDVDTGGGVQRILTDLSVAGVSSATTFRAGDGSVGTPAYSFSTANDSDLGLYRIGTDNLGIVSDNKTRVDIGTSQVEIGKTGAGNGLNLTVNGTITTTGAIDAGSANISTTGTIVSNNRRDTVAELTGTAATHTVSTSTSYNLMIRRSDGANTDFKTIELTDLGNTQLGFTFTFYMNPISGNVNPVRITNSMGTGFTVYIYDSTLSSTAVTPVGNSTNANLVATGVFSGAKWECLYTIVNSARCWIVRRIAF